MFEQAQRTQVELDGQQHHHDDDSVARAPPGPFPHAAGGSGLSGGGVSDGGGGQGGHAAAGPWVWRAINTVWRTTHTHTHTDNTELAKTTLRELVIYIAYILLLSLIVFSENTTTQYRFSNAMRELFLDAPYSANDARTFRDITDDSSFWLFLQGPLLTGLYPETLYNGDPIPANDMGFILNENKLLGMPRLRQLAVKPDSCSIPSAFSGQITTCFAPYDQNTELRTPLSPAHTPSNATAGAYIFRTASELGGSSYWGQVTTYGGGGFVQLLAGTQNGSIAIVDDLLYNLWVQRATRVVFVDFTVYNANVNLFNVVRLIVEFPASGGAIVANRFLTLKFLRQATAWDQFIMACQIMFVIFTSYYLVEEVLEIVHERKAYLKQFWSWMDITQVVLSWLAIGLFFWRQEQINSHINALVSNSKVYANFDDLSFWSYTYDIMIACTIFMAWIKIFKYISFNKTMTQLSVTLQECSGDLLGFSVMFFIVFLAYAQLGYLVLGPSVDDFHTFEESIYTLFRIILGDIDFAPIRDANRVFGPIFFVTFVFFVFFILFNMFIAIINEHFRRVKMRLDSSKDTSLNLGSVVRGGISKFLNRMRLKRNVVVDVGDALKNADVDNDGKIDFEELKKNFSDKGRAEEEVQALFAKYDLNGDRVLDAGEQKLLEQDLQRLKESLDDEERDMYKSVGMEVPQDLNASELELIKRRVARLEHSIGSIISKMDAILLRLDDMAAMRGPPPPFDAAAMLSQMAEETLADKGPSSPPPPPPPPPSLGLRSRLNRMQSNNSIERNIGLGFSSRA